MAIGAMVHVYAMRSGSPEDAFTPADAIVRFVTIVLFAMWLDRVHRNLPAIGAGREQDVIWPTLSAFFPPSVFYRPAQLIDEAWRATTPPNEEERGSPAIFLWWTLIWIPPIAYVVMLRSVAEPHSRFLVARLIAFTDIGVAALGIFVVRRLTTRLEKAATSVRRPDVPRMPVTQPAAPRSPFKPQPAIPTSFWIATLAFTMLFTGVAFVIDAALLLGMRHDAVARISAVVYLVFAGLSLGAAALLRNLRDGDPKSWPLFAMSGVLFAIVNVIALTELFPG